MDSVSPFLLSLTTVSFQVSHHPPISAFWYESTPGKGRAKVLASGVDQIAAKFNGTSVSRHVHLKPQLSSQPVLDRCALDQDLKTKASLSQFQMLLTTSIMYVSLYKYLLPI